MTYSPRSFSLALSLVFHGGYFVSLSIPGFYDAGITGAIVGWPSNGNGKQKYKTRNIKAGTTCDYGTARSPPKTGKNTRTHLISLLLFFDSITVASDSFSWPRSRVFRRHTPPIKRTVRVPAKDRSSTRCLVRG